MLLNRINDQQHGGTKHTGEERVLEMWAHLNSGKNYLCEVSIQTKVFQTLSVLHTRDLLNATPPHPTPAPELVMPLNQPTFMHLALF